LRFPAPLLRLFCFSFSDQVNEALLQKRASSLGFEGSVEQVLLFLVTQTFFFFYLM
jgi:hypothetical protein